MHISWLGQTCVKLQIKNTKDEDVIVLIDAYKPDTGDFPRSFSGNIALYSKGVEGAVTISQTPLAVSGPGEVEVKEVMVYALPGDEGNVIFKINAENMNVVHLGKITKNIPEEKLEGIGHVDILLLPVGGKGIYLDPEDANKIVTALEPRIVIPVGYQCDTDPKVGSLSDFIKEIGLKPDAPEKKLIIKKRDLPAEEMKLIVLEKNY
ncbi:MAG: MBL fold metallo-hydrolase [bacterium]|nr:MBL fold metallo-hydrolase [bacterium]